MIFKLYFSVNFLAALALDITAPSYIGSAIWIGITEVTKRKN